MGVHVGVSSGIAGEKGSGKWVEGEGGERERRLVLEGRFLYVCIASVDGGMLSHGMMASSGFVLLVGWGGGVGFSCLFIWMDISHELDCLHLQSRPGYPQ